MLPKSIRQNAGFESAYGEYWLECPILLNPLSIKDIQTGCLSKGGNVSLGVASTSLYLYRAPYKTDEKRSIVYRKRNHSDENAKKAVNMTKDCAKRPIHRLKIQPGIRDMITLKQQHETEEAPWKLV